MFQSRRIGSEAEDKAAKFLLAHGYTIITRRFKTATGEIDIIALDGDTLVFVEVRFRSSSLISPEESVTPQKAAHFHKAVEQYFHATNQPEMAARYDLIAIDKDGLRHHKSAL